MWEAGAEHRLSRMKICHIVSSLGVGGAEAFATDLCIALADAGQDVTLIVLSEATALGDNSGLETARCDQLEAAGVKVLTLGHTARRRIWPAARLMRQHLAEMRPDILHCHLKLGIVLTLLARWRGRMVVTHHNTPLHRPVWLMRLLARRADAYVTISAQAQDNLRTICRCPVHLIHNGIDLTRIAPPARQEAGAGPIRVLSLGNLRPQKNYPHLVDIAARTQPTPLTFSIAGEGSERPAIEARIADLEIGARVHLLGARSDINALLGAADLYLLTSKWEGMPIALIEAMQAGLPIVAADVGGIGEMLGRDGACGILIAPEDTAGFADALTRLATDPAQRTRMSKAARRRAEAFSIQTSATAHEALYRGLLA